MKKQDLQVGDKVRVVKCCPRKCIHSLWKGIYILEAIDDPRGFCPYKVGGLWAHQVEKLPTRGRPKGSKNKPKRTLAENIRDLGGYGYDPKVGISKCPQTLTGRHHWVKPEVRFPWDCPLPRCVLCGVYDDREESK